MIEVDFQTYGTMPMAALERIVRETFRRRLLDLTYGDWEGAPALLDPDNNFCLVATIAHFEREWRLDTVHCEALRWARGEWRLDNLHREALREHDAETWCEKHNISKSTVVEQLKRDDEERWCYRVSLIAKDNVHRDALRERDAETIEPSGGYHVDGTPRDDTTAWGGWED